jgi:Spy/CpxP family protein refolding chaperone
MKQRLALMSVLLMLLAIVPASAQQGPPPGGPPPPQGAGPVPLEFVLRAIDLTPAQRAQIEPLMRARHEAADAARPAAEAAGRALAEQVQDGTFDEEAIRAAAAEVAAFEADRAVADAALLRDIRALLTPAQREKFDRLLGPPPPPASQPSGGGPVRGRQR